VRVRLRNPVTYYRASKPLQEVAQQILGLLTLVTLREELEADAPTLVRVVHQNGPSTSQPTHVPPGLRSD